MKNIYKYNECSHTLHINGFCRDANGVDLVEFETEDDAVKKYGRTLKMCIVCMNKRENVLEQYITNQRNKGV